MCIRDSTTSVGPDGIPNVLLSKCAPGLAVPLSHLFDTFFKDGVLPSCWENADVIPIHKKGCTIEPSNYRPISLTFYMLSCYGKDNQ